MLPKVWKHFWSIFAAGFSCATATNPIDNIATATQRIIGPVSTNHYRRFHPDRTRHFFMATSPVLANPQGTVTGSRLSVINRFHRQSASLSTKFEDCNLRPSHLRKLRLRALQGRRFYRRVFARVERPLHTLTRLRPSDLAE